MADETKFYFDFNFPLKIVQFILQLVFGKRDPNNPAQTVDPANREWFSQPRTFADGGTEVITTTFKLPLSVSEITMEILRMPCTAEVWYQDRSNNWRQVLDMTRIPLKVNVSRSDVKSYFKYRVKIYPIVAKKLQFRLARVNDKTLEGTPFPVGLRNCLIRRNVYNRSQGSQYFEQEQDVLGNIISKYIKDWDAPKAIDNDPHTFWKCEPMPDPAAVASLYLDVRSEEGGPKNIDKVYIDPVYTGQHLNLYYSSDDTVGVRKISPITIAANEDENTAWRISHGRSDVSTGATESFYRWSMALGPQVSQDAWIGIEWTPGFAPSAGPSTNPILLRAMDPTGPAFKPQVYYDVGAGEFVLRFDDGTDTRNYTAPMTTPFIPDSPLRIVAGWRYDPDTVYISVRNQEGVEIAHLDSNPTTLPHLVSFDGQLEMYRFRGLITALVIKLESFASLDSNNLVISPDFEDTTILRGNFFGVSNGYTTEQAHSATHSYKIVSTGYDGVALLPISATSVGTVDHYMTVQPGQKFYFESWFYSKIGNVGAANFAIDISFRKSATPSDESYLEASGAITSSTHGSWLKTSGYITVPAGYDRMEPRAVISGATSGNIYYIDDALIREEIKISDAFQLSPTYYVDPDPVIPDANGIVPSTTLDHAVYVYAATTQEHGSGGASDTAYEDKEWTPIWRDYVAEKGMLYFPQAISMKYLKLEFTNLTEEPYPVYESGVEVRYKVFPVSVLQQSSAGPRLYTGEGGFLGLGTFISMNGVKSVNWLNPFSVLGAVGSVFQTQTDAVRITDGTSYVTDTLPNDGTELVQNSRRIEAGSSYVYRRDVLQPYILAEDQYVTIIKAEGLQALQPTTNIPWQDIAAANPGAITHVKSTGALPVRGTDWWIYPGQQLRVPAAVMKKLTDTSTVIERKLTLEKRVRFNTTSIHRYEYKTLTRDAAIAYFAGLREVQPYTSTYIAGEDKPYFEFPAYDPDQFALVHTRANEAGSTTTQRKLYPIANRLFERDLKNWILDDPTPNTGNVLVNPTFDTDISGWNLPNPTFVDFNPAWDGTDGHTAAGCVKFTGAGYAWIETLAHIPATGAVQFSGWVKAAVAGVSTVGVGVTCLDADGAWISSVSNPDSDPYVVSPVLLTSTSWTHLTGAINVPAGTVEIVPWMDADNSVSSTVRYDDVSFSVGGPWSWDGTTGRFLRGTALFTSDGLTHTMLSDLQDASQGEQIDFKVAVKWADLIGLDNNDVAIRWGIRTYLNGVQVVETALGQISYADWSANLTKDWQDLTGTHTIGAGSTTFRVFLQVTNQVSGGRVWFENVEALSHDTTTATTFKSVQTASTFAKVAVDFRDSGLWRGDSMWADINPDSESIDDTKLAYYTRTIPETMPGGMWGDTTKTWEGDDVEWGSPFGVVSVTIDGDRRYQGKRVLHFRRAAGAGEAGIKVKQWTHFVPLGLFRLGAVFYKPQANNNQATIRLRRLSDGVIVYEETVETPAGRWFEFQTKFVEIPDGVNQEYEVYLTLEGDAEDELYLSDLYTEIANIRYFVKLGGIGAFLHEVTDLRYVNGRANVSVTAPVNEFSIQAAILSPEAWAYGVRVSPTYLK